MAQYITDNPDDAKAKAMYDNYRTRLETLQNNLWQNGVTSQTRRDLAAARSAYASDVMKLQTAIKNRQERSKEYWDMKHKNPDLIMGEDPGLSGLDNYLADDLYGSNYYTYSGQQFMTEVGTDAKARAQEMLRDPEYQKNPQLAGYITRITQEGFSSQEVQNASAAVQQALATGNTAALANLPMAEGILADVLLSHLNSTGAKGSVSSAEFNRLFDYGRAGLSQAIGKRYTEDLSDKEWDFRKQLALLNAKQTTTTKKSGSGQTTPASGNGYTWNGLIQDLTSPGYRDLAKTVGSSAKHYEDGPKMIVTPDGTSAQVNSPWEMTQLVFDPEIRQTVRQMMGGLDVALPAENRWGTTDSKQTADIMVDGKMVHFWTDTREDGTVGIYYKHNGKTVCQEEMTRRFNKAVKEYQDHVQAFRDANPGIKFDDLAISPKKEANLRKKYKIDPSVNTSDIGSVVTTVETQGDYTPAVLVGTDSAFDYARNNFGRAIVSSFNHAASNGNVSKGSRFAFYKVGQGGVVTDSEGETDIKKVFGANKSGVVEPSSITDITFLPQDIAAGAGNGRPKFRFSTTASSQVWSADASMLGTLAYNALKTPRYRNGWSACDAVDFMMSPILKPSDVLAADDYSSAMWSQLVLNMLNDTSQPLADLSQIQGPVIFDNAGNARFATAQEVVRNKDLQDQLYDAVREYIDSIISVPRDMSNNQHPQHVGESSEKSPYYLPQE